MFNRKKRSLNELRNSFGRIKTEQLNFNHIRRYHDRKVDIRAIQTIGEQTCNDLDFELFFGLVDRTHSRIGQQALYNQLRTIKNRKEQFKEQEVIIKHFQNNQESKIQVQYQLSRLSSRKAYYISDLFQSETFQKPRWAIIIPVLSSLVALSIILSFFWSTFSLILLLLLPIHVIIHYSLKNRVSVFVDSIPQLLILSEVAHKLLKLKISPKTSSIKTSIKTVNSIKRRMSFFKLDQKLDSDLEAAYWFLIEMVKIIFLLEPLLFFSAAQRLANKQKDIESVFDYVSSIDIALSVHGLRTTLDNFCIPTITSGKSISAKNIRHPLIIKCIPNNLKIEVKSFLLTGSNMSGKTTLMRTIGLNHLSALTLNTAFAESFELPFCKLYTMIRVSDDLMESTSYFMKELELVKEIIDDQFSGKKLILLDELFKGTNTIERVAAASSVLTYLHKSGGFVFVASHDLELSEQLKNQFNTFHLGEEVFENEIKFDYTLSPGNPDMGNAIELMRINQFPKAIVEDAKKLVN